MLKTRLKGRLTLAALVTGAIITVERFVQRPSDSFWGGSLSGVLSGFWYLVRMKPTYPLAPHPLVAHDMDGILTHLQSHSGTANEMSYALRLTVNRVNGLLHELRAQGLVQVDHCKTVGSGRTVNIWAISKLESPAA